MEIQNAAADESSQRRFAGSAGILPAVSAKREK
jgi:hypothetical protein